MDRQPITDAPPAKLTLLERGAELVRVETVLERGCLDSGRLMVIEGPAGIGKTAMLSAACAAAQAKGMRLLRARGAQLEREFAFGVVRQLLEPPLAEADDAQRAEYLEGVAGVAAAMLELPGAGGDGTGIAAGPDPPFAVLHGLYCLCAKSAPRSPCALPLTTRTGRIRLRCGSSRSCSRGWRDCRWP
ncbi:MAG: AAA family ATPase [Solirubrobacteraceae bacterium]